MADTEDPDIVRIDCGTDRFAANVLLARCQSEGLDVELLPPSDPSIVPRAIASGQADIGIHYQPNLYLDHAAGVPLIRVGTVVETPLNTVTVLADGPIQSLKDLKGRKVGYSVSGTEEAILSAMLRTVGLGMTDVELINVNFSLSPSLISGQVDAVIGAYRNFELNQMDIVGRPGRAFFVEEHGVPPFDQLIYVARNDRVDDPRLGKLLDATERAVQFMVNHPDDAWSLFVRNYPELDDELNRRAWRDTLPRFALRPAALDVRRYERMAAFMKDAGLIASTPPVASYAATVR